MSSIRVTRQGLTCCPQCKSYIKLAQTVAETTCPFCQTSLSESTVQAAPSRLSGKGKALLSAALLGTSLAVTAVACNPGGALYGGPPAEQPTNTEPTADSGTPPAPAYGQPAPKEEVVVETDAGPSGALYGGPPSP